MRKVFTEDLPRVRRGIDWTNCIGKDIKFIYDDIEGVVEIIDYHKENHKITFTYNNKTFYKHSGTFNDCGFADVVGKISSEFKYKENDIIDNKLIIEQIYMNHIKSNDKGKQEKGYKYKCLICNTEHECNECGITNIFCPICSHKATATGVNDIATTHPDLIKYFKYKNDAYIHSYSSNCKVWLVCPNCGYEKYMTITHFTNRGFACNRCSDGKSYNEKFMFSILEQLHLTFNAEYTFKDISFIYNNEEIHPRYDFVLHNDTIVIETDGRQHKNGYGIFSTIEYQQTIDKEKDKLVQSLGYEMIRIDCSNESFESLKQNILKSRLSYYFDLNNIDWNLCNLNATKSLIFETAKLWNSGIKDIQTLANKIGVVDCTITEYLKKTRELKLTDYTEKLSIKYGHIKRGFKIRRPIKCIENDFMFSGIIEAVKQSKNVFGVEIKASSFGEQLSGRNKVAKGYTFSYITEDVFKKAYIETPKLCFGGEIKYE